MSDVRVHILKCWPEPFRALKSGAKKHEVRKNDRGFMVGDYLKLMLYEPHPCADYDFVEEVWLQSDGTSGEFPDAHEPESTIWLRVTYKSAGGTWGLPADLCVLSVEPCEEPKP